MYKDKVSKMSTEEKIKRNNIKGIFSSTEWNMFTRKLKEFGLDVEEMEDLGSAEDYLNKIVKNKTTETREQTARESWEVMKKVCNLRHVNKNTGCIACEHEKICIGEVYLPDNCFHKLNENKSCNFTQCPIIQAYLGGK